MMKHKALTRKLIWLFLFFLSFGTSAQVTRQPYLQMPTPNSMVVRWKTGTGVVGKLYYGTSASSFTQNSTESEDERIYHEVKITGLNPDTKYYYSVGGPSKGSEDQYFITPPDKETSTPVRIWVISDFGQTNSSDMSDNLISKSTTITDANKINIGLGRADKDDSARKPSGCQPHKGTIFISCTGGGVANSAKYYPKPLSIFPIEFAGSDYKGSVVIDVNGNQMDVKFIGDEENNTGSHIWDYFTLTKNN